MLARKAVLNTLYYSGLQALLSPILSGRGAILMFHHVRDEALTSFSPNYHLSIAPSFLDQLLSKLALTHEFISLDEVHARLIGKSEHGKKPFLAITLDDGYRNNIEFAAPIFRKHAAPYTIYVAPEMSNGKVPIWWEDVEHCIRMSSELEVRFSSGAERFDTSDPVRKCEAFTHILEKLFWEEDETTARQIVNDLSSAAGHDPIQHVKSHVADLQGIRDISNDPLCTIGAHTMAHHVLSKLDEKTLQWELSESKAVLEAEVGRPVEHLAYPYGNARTVGAREIAMSRELGFKTAVTTRHGVIYDECAEHLHCLPRASINGHYQTFACTKTLLSGIPTRLKNKGRKLDVA